MLWTDDMSQVLHLLLEQVAPGGLAWDAGLLQQEEDFTEVLDVIVHGPEEDNHVVQVHQARLPPQTGQDDVESSLEGGWRVHQTKREPEKSEQARVRRELRLVSVLGGHRDLPGPSVRVHGREHCGISEGVQAVVHPRDWVDILDRALVQPSVVRAKPEVTSWIGHDEHSEGPLGVRGFYDT